MSIFKQTLSPNIADELKVRQEAMLNRTPKDLMYLNSRNSWIRMSSAVDIYKKTAPQSPNITIKDLKEKGNYDNSLAKKYILQGGVLTEHGTLKSGVGNFDNAYSNLSADNDPLRLGIRPMPGITTIEIKSLGAYGSLREVTVNFNCWDIHQLEDLELLYMRPGYTVLIEWGWAPYLDTKGNPISTVQFYDIVNNPKPKEDIFKDLDAKMKEHGNYEAMFGYIKNYSWKARMDGGYDCQTTVVSLGEVIESLKVNYSPSSILNQIKKKGYLGPHVQSVTNATTDNTSTGKANESDTGLWNNIKKGTQSILSSVGIDIKITDEDEMEEQYQKNILAGIFYELYKIAQDKAFSGNISNTADEGENAQIVLNTPNGKVITLSLFHKTINIHKNGGKKEVGDSDEQYYISLQSLCDLLNEFVTLRDKDNKTTFIELTTKDKEGNDLLCLAHPLQVSTDPTICLVKNLLWAEKINFTSIPSTPTPGRSAYTVDKGKPLVQFSHNLSNSDGFMDELIALGCATNADSISDDKKQEIANWIKDTIQGPSNARYSDTIIEQNVKELSAKYKVKYDNKNYKVKQPSSINVSKWGLTVKKSNVGKTIDDIFYSDPTTFYQLLEDDYAFNFDDKLTKQVITPEGGDSSDIVEAADGNVIADEQDKIEEENEKLKEETESAKKALAFLKNIPLPFFVDDNYTTELGIIGNIFINLNFLYNSASDDALTSQDKKEKNDISLFTFIKNIIQKIAESIGGQNNFEIFSEPNGKEARIIDINYADKEDAKTAYENATLIEIHNLKSTVRSYAFESKIFPEQASQVAIGAQVEGGALGTDTTTLVNFNRKVRDRIIPVKDAPMSESVADDQVQKKQELISNLETLAKYFSRLETGKWYTLWLSDADFDADKANDYNNALKDIINFIKAICKSKTNSKAIIPTTLSLDMDGLGGLIIGNIFKIPEDLLPKGYKGGEVGSKIGYAITRLGHSVGNGDWVTKVESQFIVFDDMNPLLETIDYENITINTNPGINPTTGEAAPIIQTSTTEKGPLISPPADLVKAMREYGITDPKERAHFLAQCAHESGGFKWKKEFASGEAYEGRKDLGNIQPGDGKRFKGRGYIQITGRTNYTKYNTYLKSKGIKDDIITNPTLVEGKFAADSACYWWKYLSRNISSLALAGVQPYNVSKVSTRVNGKDPSNGLDDRQKRFNTYWAEIQKNPSSYA